MITQKDVAKKAGVSRATVSAIVNKNKFVSKEIEKRVLDTIKQLDYRPNLIARSLKLKTSKSIGVIFPDIENPFFLRFIKKVEELAYDKGYSVILCITEHDTKKEKEYIKTLQGKLVDGYIVIPTSSMRSKEYEELFIGENVIFVDRNSNIRNEICIKLDNIKASKMVVDYFVGLGHRRIGIINIPLNITPGIERFEGYRIALKDNNIEFDPELIMNADYSIENAYQKTKELMELKNRPTAIYSTGILTSVGCLKYLVNATIKIPEDVSFIGIDELYDYSELLMNKPTVIKQPVEEFAIKAIYLLQKKMGKKPFMKSNLLIEPEILIKDSCRKII
jgi:LacI family transcriptional regulator